ncbi:MAG: hypothetical protein IJJ59_14995 [Pseudobutyrivibrio sp.]|uniref:hypothetical protein n=1 Tax=Pseudobutyrivibrio sp. TaxID=2014367 RepID=UPI0025D12ED9|nr:hypothetical protein [Pseudobutyrivibrio sp.]MBQ6464630.1 hypothetical protein [Pseudobutyrivibrio sp.]
MEVVEKSQIGQYDSFNDYIKSIKHNFSGEKVQFAREMVPYINKDNYNILTSKEDIEAFYMPLGEAARIKAFVMDKFDVAPRERSFTVSEFAEFVVRDEGVVAC